ncbi:MAG: ABC transporter substrate-binding protein [Candidatus Rokuibacteriota bacterium]
MMTRPAWCRPVVPALIAGLLVLSAGVAMAQTALKVAVVPTPPALSLLSPYVAKEEGFFAKHGLSVELLELRTGSLVMKAVLAGEADLGHSSSSEMVAVSKGAKARAIMSPTQPTDYMIVADKSIASLGQLEGKTLAVSAPGSIAYDLPRLLMRRAGGNPEKAKYVSIGSQGDRLRALAGKQVDATLLSIDYAVRALEYPHLKILASAPEALPDYVFVYLYATEETIAAKAEALTGYVKAILLANRYMDENKAGTLRIAKKHIPGASDTVLDQSYDFLKKGKVFTLNGGLDEKAFLFTRDILMESGSLKTAITPAQFMEPRFLKRALDEVGRR